MAENEILDLGGRRWKPTRAALAKPDLSISAMAQCVADNLQAVLQSSLRKGQTLLSVFQAVDRHPRQCGLQSACFKISNSPGLRATQHGQRQQKIAQALPVVQRTC